MILSWLHHANVDRLFAIWEAMNPGNTMVSLQDSYGTFVIPRGTLEGLTTPLQPFSTTENGPWYDSTPESRSLKTFGYTYPEINDWNKTQDQQQKDAVATVNRMYNPNNAFSKRADNAEAQVACSNPSQCGQTREWSIALSVAKFDLFGERFIILFFLGDVPQDPAPTSPRCVGSFPVFPPPKPATAADGYPLVVAYSEYSLNDGLKSQNIDGQDVDATKGFLKANLHWVVTKV
jgi:hypothetical protein